MGLGCSYPRMEPQENGWNVSCRWGAHSPNKDWSPWSGGLKNRRPEEREQRMIVWPSMPEVANAICSVASGKSVANYMGQRVGAGGLAVENRSED